MKIEVLFEDEDLLAVNKPAGLPVHATVDPRRPHLQGLLESQLNTKLVLHHRLDLDTTGVTLFSKGSRFNKELTDIFRDRVAQKTYWAVVEGRWLPEWSLVQTLIEKVHGGKWANVSKGGKIAVTHFSVIQNLGERTWIQAQPQTGRTHQIRLHCLFHQHPICGDRDYGRPHSKGVPIALHARELRFPHPKDGSMFAIEAPEPAYWRDYWLKNQ